MQITRRSTRWMALPFVSLVAMTACDGGDEADAADDTEDTGSQLSFAADIQPIFDDNCSCHSPGGVAVMTMDLSGSAFDDIVGVNSVGATGVVRVVAGDSANSYLVAKLQGTQVEIGGSGGQMPADGTAPLDPALVQTIIDWIDAGAPE